MSGLVATRLTCFAVLSAVEADLRTLVRAVCSATGEVSVLSDALRAVAIDRRLRDRSNSDSDSADDSSLLEYIDFGDLAEVLRPLDVAAVGLSAGSLAGALDSVVRLVPARNRVCHSRPLEPDDLAGFLDLSESLLSGATSTSWRRLRETADRLRQHPAYVLQLTIPLFWRPRVDHCFHNLPSPDFDDTGFIGRDSDRRKLGTLLASAHPVITIVGSGGVGKTALALRCLFDMLELPKEDRAFDALVWISLKTRVLGVHGVAEMKGMIASTLRVARDVAGALGTVTPDATAESLFAEIGEYLRTFRVLVALDNLESLPDTELRSEAFRAFITGMPPGSKLLITSRIGLGEFEVRFPLDPLDRKAAIALLRRHALSLNIAPLSSAQDALLTRYVEDLQRNPLLIKWFVSSVARGAAAEDLVNRSGASYAQALRFCFENLFQRLSDAEREVVQVLAAARRPLSRPELRFIMSKTEPSALDWALNTLHNSSLLKQSLEGSAGATDTITCYTLTDAASEYTRVAAPPDARLYASVQERLRELGIVADRERVMKQRYKYDVFSIRAASREELVCASILRRALTAVESSDFATARASVKEAQDLLPSYSENHRVAAIVEAKAGEIYLATEEYEAAIEADPKSTIALYAYGLFLLDFLEDHQQALAQFDRALALDRDEPTLLTVKALSLTRLGQYADAASVYASVLAGLASRPRRWRISTRDQAAECQRRWAEQSVRDRDWDQFKAHVRSGLEILAEGVRKGDWDEQTVGRAERLVGNGIVHCLRVDDPDFAEDLVRWCEWAARAIRPDRVSCRHIDEFGARYPALAARTAAVIDELNGGRSGWQQTSEPTADAPGSAPTVMPTERRSGRICKLAAGRPDFGFIADDRGGRLFFHVSRLRERDSVRLAIPGARVRFSLGSNNVGPCAVDIEII